MRRGCAINAASYIFGFPENSFPFLISSSPFTYFERKRPPSKFQQLLLFFPSQVGVRKLAPELNRHSNLRKLEELEVWREEIMEFYHYPSQASQAPSSSSSSSTLTNMDERGGNTSKFTVSAILGSLFSAIFVFFFALVGTLLGAMTGALIGQETESGFIRGSAIGAISGAVFSIEVFESSVVLWRSDETGIGCILYLIDVIASLLSGRLVRERIGPAMLSAVQSQMGAMESTFEEASSFFETEATKGLPCDMVESIPKIKITSNNNVDASGEKASCSVCLQDFQMDETVRSLPQCHHMFHLPCIDKWLVRHGSCPLCRRDL